MKKTLSKYFEDTYPDYHIRDVIECNDPLSLDELTEEYCTYLLRRLIWI